MTRLATALGDRYRVERELGAGGMATVYLAHDLKHDRDVAIKVLHPDLGAALGAERFLSEIRTTARLQHPHILPLLDSGEADGLLYYVMPVVTGETLRARLERERQLPIPEAVRIAREVAQALDYAHRQGVIHRDIKPENVLLHDGSALVADFGIALAVQTAGGQRMTQTGLSLGTPQYMSPEQAMGERTIDARSDIYALGAMTYEMLTGEPPFTGATVQAVVAKVLSAEPERPTLMRKTIPPGVEHAVLMALAKLPADRFATAGAFAEALAGGGGAVSASAVSHARGPLRGSRALTVALGAVALVATAAAAWFATHRAGATQDALVAQFDVPFPDSVQLWQGWGNKIAISRDGRRLVMLGFANGRRGLWARRLDEGQAHPIRGGESFPDLVQGANPALSPDGRFVVYGKGRGVSLLPFEGGTERVLVDSGATPAWGDGDVILYLHGAAIWRVSPDGRDRRLVASADTAHGVFRFKWPEVLPGGTHAIVVLDHDRSSGVLDSLHLAVLSIADGRITPLGIKGMQPKWAGDGTLLYGTSTGTVEAVPFSLSSWTVTGSPTRILESVWQANGGATGYHVSWNGVLVYHGSGLRAGERQIVAVNAQGRERLLASVPGFAAFPAVSPDGRRIAWGDGVYFEGGASLLDLPTGTRQQLATRGDGARPVWSRDGRTIYLLRQRGGRSEVVARAPDGSRPDSVLLSTPTYLAAFAPGPAHGWAVLRVSAPSNDLVMAPMDSLMAWRPLAAAINATEVAPALSADGRWAAYNSDESGIPEVFVRPVPGKGPRLQLSANGGWDPRWDPDGRHVYYRGASRVMVVELGGTPLAIVRRDSLFADVYERLANVNHANWDLMPLTREFVLVRTRYADVPSVVVNWRAWRSTAAQAAP